jgi:hypothetical protein
MLPPLLLGALFVVLAIRFISKQPFHSIYYFFILFALLLCGFLVYHALLAMALYKTTHWGKYGVYFQDFMPATVWLLTALLCFYQRNIKRWQLISGLVVLGVFQIFAVWSVWALYAGCAIKGIDRQIVFTDQFLCLGTFNQVWHINSVLTNTTFSIICLLGAMVLMGILSHQSIAQFLEKPRLTNLRAD